MQITPDLLDDVNKEYNQYEYATEVADDWTPIDLTKAKKDDCDSYATAKAEKLLRLGCPASALRLAVCTVWKGGKLIGGHLVLLVELDGQTYVLDNRFTFAIKIQDLPRGEYQWVSLWHIDTGKWHPPLGLQYS